MSTIKRGFYQKSQTIAKPPNKGRSDHRALQKYKKMCTALEQHPVNQGQLVPE